MNCPSPKSVPLCGIVPDSKPVSMSDQGSTQEDWNKGESSCPLPGCTDEDACNYDELASCDDGSCTYSCYGCTNSSACNYDSSATIDCPNSTSNLNIDCIPCDFSSCKGCTESQACNYDEAATMDDGTCEYTSCIGCMDKEACDYDPEATKEGSCDYDSCVTPTATGVPVYYEYASCEDSNFSKRDIDGTLKCHASTLWEEAL